MDKKTDFEIGLGLTPDAEKLLLVLTPLIIVGAIAFAAFVVWLGA